MNQFIDRGWAIIPIPAGQKGPKRKGWNTPAGYFTTRYEIESWWAAHPNDNCGVVLGPSNLCSLDVDNPPVAESVLLANGIDAAKLRTTHPTIVGNPQRYRILFAAPKGIELSRKTIGAFELRAGAVQDVLPPSLHPCGSKYYWATPLPAGELLKLPNQLLQIWLNWSMLKMAA